MRSNRCLIAGCFLLLNSWSAGAKTAENIPLGKPVLPSAELRYTNGRRLPEDSPLKITQSGVEVATAPTRAEIESAANTAEARGRIVTLTPAGASVPTILKELASLPVTFRSVIGKVSYDITVMKMALGPDGSRLTVGCRFGVPGGDVLYFGAGDISVSAASGFGGDLPIVESLLSEAGAGEIDDPQNRLEGATRFAEISWPNFKGKATLGLGKESRMTFSCGLFKKFTLNGFMKIRDLTERETPAGTTLNDQKPLMLFWGTQEVTDWEDMYFEATVSRGFHAASCRDLGFHFSDPAGIVLDLSRYRSPVNLPDCGLQNKEEWQGVGFESFQLRLPTLFKLRTPKALTGRGTNLFLGPDGLIGNMTAEKVFSLEEGYTDEINKFDLSLEAVSAVFGCGAAETMMTMSGRVRLGNCTAGDEKRKELDYRVIFNKYGRNYRVMVKESTADRFQNTGLTLSTGSVLTLTVNEDGFKFTTALAKKPLLTTPAYNNSICLNYPTTITVQNCDGLFRKWSTDETGLTQLPVNPASEGSYTYKINCRDSYCISEDSEELTITVYESLPQPSLLASKNAFCTTESSVLNAANCVGKMEWKLPDNARFEYKNTNEQLAVHPGIGSSTGFEYQVRCNLNTCHSPVKSLTVQVHPEPGKPNLNTNASNNTIDRGGSVTLSGSCQTNHELVWENLPQATVTLYSSVTYSGYCINRATGCRSQSQSIGINVLYLPPAAPLASISGSGTDYVTVSWIDNAVNEDEYRVYRASSVAFTDAVEIARLGAGATSYSNGGLPEGNTFYYKVVAYNRYDESHSNVVSGTTSVTPPTINPPDPPTSCTVSQPSVVSGASTITQGQSVTVSASCASGDIVWTAPAGFTGGNVQPTSTTTYTAKCRVSDDCESHEQSVVVSVNSVGCTAPAAPTVGSGLTVCRGNTAILSAGGCEGGTITWSSGSSLVVADATTSYTAVCSLNGCTSESSASLTVTVVEVAVPSVLPDHASVRIGETVTVSASCPGGETVVWTAPDNFSGGSHSPSVTTEYKAKCRDGNGCESGEGRTTVSICAPPSAPSITVNDITISTGGGMLIATGCNGGTVTWSGGQTGPSLPVTQAGTYTATCTVANDCGTNSSSDDGRVTIFDTPCIPPPVPKATADTYELAPGETTNLHASGTGSMIWAKDGFYTNITENVGPGTYKVRATNGQCDSDYSPEIVISVKSAERLAYTGKWLLCDGEQSTARSFSGCDGGSVTVHLNGRIYTEDKLIIAQYYAAQCSASGASTTFSVTSGTKPSSIVITPLLPEIKSGESVMLMITADGAKSYKWNTGESGSTITVSPTSTTSYSVTAFSESNHSGCQASSAPRSVKVISGAGTCTNPPTKPTISEVVSGCKVILTATNCNGSIKWNTNSTASSIEVTMNGTYTAYCSTPNCTENASVPVNVQSVMGHPAVEMNRVQNAPFYDVSVAVSKATSYVWTVNGTVDSQTSDTIRLPFGTSFTVRGHNDCGDSNTYTGSIPNN